MKYIFGQRKTCSTLKVEWRIILLLLYNILYVHDVVNNKINIRRHSWPPPTIPVSFIVRSPIHIQIISLEVPKPILHLYNIILLVSLNHSTPVPLEDMNIYSQQEPRLDNTLSTYISFLSVLLAGNKDGGPNFPLKYLLFIIFRVESVRPRLFLLYPCDVVRKSQQLEIDRHQIVPEIVQL